MVWTSPDGSVCAMGHCGSSASAMARSFRYARQLRWRTFPRKPPPTVCRPWKRCAFPYSGRQTVIYSRNVIALVSTVGKNAGMLFASIYCLT
jgi:hypothetical protein